MNSFEKWYCGSALWRYLTRRQLLPWMLHGTVLGEHVLELGAGAGPATIELAMHSSVSVIQGDAAALPFPNATFSSAIAILMLHHLKSSELQNRAFSEIHRVLRPSGVFLAFDIPNGWIHRVAHIKSTFVPLDPAAVARRLIASGLSKVTLDSRSGGFLIRAMRAN